MNRSTFPFTLRRIGRRGLVSDPQPPEHPLETLGLEDLGARRHHRLYPNAHPSVVAECREQKGGGALSSFVALGFHIGHPAVIVHRGEDEGVAGFWRSLPPVSRHPVPRSFKPGELLGVQVQEYAGSLYLEAPGWRLGF